ncbi:hypothetical protein AAGC94_04420 [Clostridium sporogenes]|uniref:hypothetical protein n=1 Tax=Clostridium sporogenes TaxID=1509 RepID=UPI0029064095|nr:hypothetical protein [Clostridium sporogenes]
MLSKRTTSKIILTLVLGLLISPIQTAHASENKNSKDSAEITQSIQIKTNDIKNLKMLKETDTELIYTYEQNNQIFKTEEVTSGNQVLAKVYKMNSDGTFIKLDEIKTIVDREKDLVIQEINGQKNVMQLSQTIVEDPVQNVMRGNIPKPPQNTWVYMRTDKGSNKYNKFLLSTGANILAGTLGVGYGVAFAILRSAVNLNLDTVYYTTKVYYKYRGFLAVQGKYVSNVYSDSARKNLIKANVVGYKTLTR